MITKQIGNLTLRNEDESIKVSVEGMKVILQLNGCSMYEPGDTISHKLNLLDAYAVAEMLYAAIDTIKGN
jgi:hypothetical protein